MNAYERTLQEDMAGLTEERKIAALRAITVSDISRDHVEDWFRETELWYEGQKGFRGPVQKVFDDDKEDKFDDDIEYLYATVFGKQRVDFLRTTVAPWALRVAEIVDTVMAVMEKPVEAQLAYRASFYQLGGGLQWPDMDAAALAQAKTEYEQAQADAEAQRLADEEAQRLADEAAELERQQAEQAEQTKRQLRAFLAAKSAVATEQLEAGQITATSQIVDIFAAG